MVAGDGSANDNDKDGVTDPSYNMESNSSFSGDQDTSDTG